MPINVIIVPDLGATYHYGCGDVEFFIVTVAPLPETLSLRLQLLARLADTGITVPLIIRETIENPKARIDATNSVQADRTWQPGRLQPNSPPSLLAVPANAAKNSTRRSIYCRIDNAAQKKFVKPRRPRAKSAAANTSRSTSPSSRTTNTTAHQSRQSIVAAGRYAQARARAALRSR